MGQKSNEIRDFTVASIAKSPGEGDLVGKIAAHFRLTRQAVQYHVNGLIERGIIAAKGNTRNRTYTLIPFNEFVFELPIKGLEEDRIFETHIRKPLAGVRENHVEICYYGFTEMLNNVIDHSLGTVTKIRFIRTHGGVTMYIVDNGVGIFRKVSEALGLTDHRHALLELSKGKFTTDPKNHTGEGIFFSSRVFDRFAIFSEKLSFLHARGDDWLFEDMTDFQDGTTVMMQINVDSTETLGDVFARFHGKSESGFSKTHVPIAVAQYGDENLVSRSQAKRVLTRFERFGEVWLDFSNVKSIGQAFADQIFRVFSNNNPQIELIATGCNKQVQSMIDRAKENAKSGSEPGQQLLFDPPAEKES